MRLRLADGAQTTLHVATYHQARTAVRVVRFPHPVPLAAWCAEHDVAEAIVGGFFVRATGHPLGEVRTSGIVRPSVPFDAPWDALRACVHADGGRVALARRPDLPAAPRGDLLQAGPLLVRDGRPVFRREEDREGFRAANGQFDSDITDGRYPRAAIGLGEGRMFAVAVDGRSETDAGLTLEELSALLTALGAHTAMNLDGGGSTTLVHRRHLLNRPYSEQDQPAPASRPIVTAVLL
jgi:hypothetical protein